MDWLYLAFSTVFMAAGAITGGIYNRKCSGGNTQPLYAVITTFAALVPWGIFFIFDSAMEPRVLIYSLIYGICYASTHICFITALKYGPVSLSNLLLQFSLIVTSVWGFFFWNSELKATVFIGLAVAALSLVLCLCRKESAKVNLKWLLFAVLTLVSNAGSSILLKDQQIAFDYKYGTAFMFFSMVLGFLLSLAWFFLSKKPASTVTVIKKCGVFPAITGLTNFALNYFIILLAAGILSPSLIYPVIAIGGLAITSIVSLVFFKEKLSAVQWIGIALGGIAVALLSI